MEEWNPEPGLGAFDANSFQSHNLFTQQKCQAMATSDVGQENVSENDEKVLVTDNCASVVLVNAAGRARKFVYQGETPKNAKLGRQR